MQGRKNITLAGRSKPALDALARQVEGQPQYQVSLHQIVNGHTDPLHGLDFQPDILVLRVTPNSLDELAALAARAAGERPPLIVIGPSQDPHAMRLAMQCGARDFLSEPLNRSDLLAALERVASEVQQVAGAPARARSISFINAKGGSGASFLAANVAHALVSVHGQDTVLIDVDLQFGTLPQYLDVQLKRGLLEAMEVVHELDGLAVDAYLARHVSGLRVLARSQATKPVHVESGAERYLLLLEMLRAKCQRIVFDVPRHLDAVGAATLERSDRIVMVMQQTLPSLRDASRLLEIVRDEIGVPADRISVLINRYRKGATVEVNDIRRTLRDEDPLLVPNHFGPVAESIDAGVPICEHTRSSPVAKAIVDIATQLDGRPPRGSRSFINRTISSILRT